MISPSTVYWLSALTYLVTLGVFLSRRDSAPEQFERLFDLVAVVLGVAVVATTLQAVDVLTVPYMGDELRIMGLVNASLAYPVLWYVTARLGGASRRMQAVVVGLPFAQVVVFQLGGAVGGLVGLLSILFTVSGHLVLIYLFMGPIWRGNEHLPDGRRILHWKGRNLLLFMIGMLIVFAVMSVGGLLTPWALLVLNQYIGVLIRVGFAAFLLVNLGAMATTGMASDADGADGVGTTQPAD